MGAGANLFEYFGSEQKLNNYAPISLLFISITKLFT